MKVQMQVVKPFEAGFWHYPHFYEDSTSSIFTISDSIDQFGLFVLSEYDDQKILPSVALLQAFLDAAYGDQAHMINPVLGISTLEDLRIGALNKKRDFALPFPKLPLPKIADDIPSPYVNDFQRHDFYHGIRLSAIIEQDIALYIEVGDALSDTKNFYIRMINGVLKHCKERILIDHDRYRLLAAIEKTGLNNIPEDLRNKIMQNLKEDYLPAIKIISLLKQSRAATGRFKFLMYDLELCSYTNEAKELKKKWGEKYFHLHNIMRQMRRQGLKNTSLLRGQAARRAGTACFCALKKHGYNYEKNIQILVAKKDRKIQKLITQANSKDVPDKKVLKKLANCRQYRDFYSSLDSRLEVKNTTTLNTS